MSVPPALDSGKGEGAVEFVQNQEHAQDIHNRGPLGRSRADIGSDVGIRVRVQKDCHGALSAGDVHAAHAFVWYVRGGHTDFGNAGILALRPVRNLIVVREAAVKPHHGTSGDVFAGRVVEWSGLDLARGGLAGAKVGFAACFNVAEHAWEAIKIVVRQEVEVLAHGLERYP